MPSVPTLAITAFEIVCDAVTHRHPTLYERDGDQLVLHFSGDVLDLRDEERPPLETAALCVQEDLCVMQERSGAWCLTAGSVCFPTRWELDGVHPERPILLYAA